MPDPPSVGLVTRFLFENPYPVGLLSLAVAGGLLWTGLREGRRERLTIAAIGIALGAAVLTIGAAVVTSGERARTVTIELVEARSLFRSPSDVRLLFRADSVTIVGDMARMFQQVSSVMRIKYRKNATALCTLHEAAHA